MKMNLNFQSIKVLLIEDNPDDILITKKVFAEIKKMDFELICVDRLQTAIEYLNQQKVDVILLDLGLPESQGLDTFHKLHTQIPEVPIVVLSGFDDIDTALKAIYEGAQDYLIKQTYNSNAMVRIIRYAMERYQILKELDQKNKELKKLDEMKDEFVLMVSHELRTPLAIMKTYINILLDEIQGKINDQQKIFLTIVYNNIGRLTGVINDLLDMNKINIGKMKIFKSNMNLAKQIKQVVNFFEIETMAKNITLKLEIPTNLAEVFADEERIVQVLINIIGNAIKFTHKGGKIVIQACQKDKFIEVSILNTGDVIATKDLERIFEPFNQGNQTTDISIKGTGLGLTITKKIIELHQGKIWAENIFIPEGKGCKFNFLLPKFERKVVFREGLSCAIKEARETRASLCLYLIGIKDFASLQELASSEEIQFFLEKIMNKIKNTFRNADIIIPYEKEGIMALLTDGKKEMVFLLIERLNKFISDDEFFLSDKSFKVLLNYGISCFPEEADEENELLIKLEKSWEKEKKNV
ncbi:MAG: ATP-binding protein [bacterium]